jgi:anaerobic ribonucleoside-triphosphate reductase
MEELNDTFEQNKYKVISLNKETGQAEFKFITHCKKLDNHRNIVTIIDNQGRKVRVTDNHRIMTVNGLEITEATPDKCEYTLSPKVLQSAEDLKQFAENNGQCMAYQYKLDNLIISDIVSKDEEVTDEFVYDISVEDNENFLTYECIYVHNSRAGAQVPFSSINYGTDTSVEGRMVMETILKTTQDGLGNGETPIFPQLAGALESNF